MIDSTQDIAVMDQLAICVRYIENGKVQERLLRIMIVNDATGKGLYDRLKDILTKFYLSMSDVIACSFDGAANIKGDYNGLKAHTVKENPLALYIHYQAHVLTLVMTDSTSHSIKAEKLFGLVQQVAIFLSDSCKRMSVWQNLTQTTKKGHEKSYRLNRIDATRWWSRDKALSSVFELPENILNILY